jgi:hypothetical protein
MNVAHISVLRSLVMAAVAAMLAGACGVAAPGVSEAPEEAVSTKSDDREATPSFVTMCPAGNCESLAACLAAHGHAGAACSAFGNICCETVTLTETPVTGVADEATQESTHVGDARAVKCTATDQCGIEGGCPCAGGSCAGGFCQCNPGPCD